jgi:hypothetical protein
MAALLRTLSAGNRSLSYSLGTLLVAAAAAVMATSKSPDEIVRWAEQVFGVSFLVLFGLLGFAVLFCWARMLQSAEVSGLRRFWLEAGLHAANGIGTLALTYTLLGISLGIGSLADTELTPATIQQVIRGLTGHFSLAFLTTVIGLPTSAVARALLLLTEQRSGVQAQGGLLVTGKELS